MKNEGILFMKHLLENCTLCPRACHANRVAGQRGYCGMGSTMQAARAALHMWEEPWISGKKGSGAVFFSGCTLRCVFCQNYEIASGRSGREITEKDLTEIFLRLEAEGAANLNLVTACHYVPLLIPALQKAKDKGLSLPVIYNSSGYENRETLWLLEGLVDVYLPDFKYMDASLAERYSHAKDYPERAREALKEMVRQSGPCAFDEEGYIIRGTIVRHLILPGHTRDSRNVLNYLHSTYGNEIYISVMNQYTPLSHVDKYPEINRKITKREYEKVLAYALSIGIENGFFQEGGTAEESFIPAFDCEGL